MILGGKASWGGGKGLHVWPPVLGGRGSGAPPVVESWGERLFPTTTKSRRGNPGLERDRKRKKNNTTDVRMKKDRKGICQIG